jgi:ketosteroid isomerase-like protein
MTEMAHENVEVVRRAIDAFAQGDFEAIRAESHPDVEIDWSASRGLEAGVYRGFEETEPFLRTFHETFERFTVEADRFIESGDLVLVPNTTRFLGRDGIEAVARSCIVYELRDGRIARIRMYQETDEALESEGLRE